MVGTGASISHRSVSFAYYNVSMKRLEHMADHETEKKKENETLEKNCLEDIRFPVGSEDLQDTFMEMRIEFERFEMDTLDT